MAIFYLRLKWYGLCDMLDYRLQKYKSKVGSKK